MPANDPFLTRVGLGVREAHEIANRQVPAPQFASLANLVSQQGANLRTGLSGPGGQKYVGNQYEAKSFGQLIPEALGGYPAGASPTGQVRAKPAPVAPVASKPGVLGPMPALNQQPPLAELNALPGVDSVKNWSGARVMNTGFTAPGGAPAPGATTSPTGQPSVAGATGPAEISVSKQSDGTLSFTGKGGDGTGAVKYTGMPNWTSQQGGAGKGYVGAGFDLAAQNQRMATALQNIQSYDDQKNAREMIDAMASGAGGPTGVAQNKLAMGALGPLLERQMANETALQTTGMTTATQRAGQETAAKSDAERTAAMRYNTDVAKSTADAQMEVDRERIRAVAAVATRKAALGKPMTAQERSADLLNRGFGPDGKPFKTLAEEQAATRRFLSAYKGDPLAAIIAAGMPSAPEPEAGY